MTGYGTGGVWGRPIRIPLRANGGRHSSANAITPIAARRVVTPPRWWSVGIGAKEAKAAKWLTSAPHVGSGSGHVCFTVLERDDIAFLLANYSERLHEVLRFNIESHDRRPNDRHLIEPIVNKVVPCYG